MGAPSRKELEQMPMETLLKLLNDVSLVVHGRLSSTEKLTANLRRHMAHCNISVAAMMSSAVQTFCFKRGES